MSIPDDKTQLREADEPTGNYQPIGPRDPLVGRTLKDTYQIEGRIGEGGMGVVYRATQVNLGRPVAVKTIATDRQPPPQALDRFFREVRLLSQLHHPNIVNIIDFGTDSGPVHFMVMEYLHGETLEAFVQARGRLSPDLVLDLMEQICAGVEAAHQKGILHRDLKPSNVLVLQVTGSTRPIVKILDFGLGKMLDTSKSASNLTREGMLMGTLCYSAPEQLEGSTVDERADIYSLGAVLYFLLSGRPPYRDEGFRSTLVKQLSQPPDPLELTDLPPEQAHAIEEIVHRAMSPSPRDRPATPTELYLDLARIRRPDDTFSDRSRPSRIEPRPRREPLRPTPSRRRFLVAGGLAVAATAGGLGVWLSRHGRRPSGPGATAPGVTGTEITLGMTGPFSGVNRELGRAMRTGLMTCFHHVNDEGGVHGRRIHLEPLDDGYEPSRAIENLRRLLNEYNVFGFVGNVGTPTTEAVLPLVLENQRVLFAPYTGASFLRRDPPDRYVFNYRASYAEETAAIVRYLVEVKKLPPDTIAVFAQNDSYGEAGFSGVARALRRHGRSADEIPRFSYARNSTRVDEAMAGVVAMREKLRAVVMVATYRPAAEFIQRVRDAGLNATLTNVSFVGSEALSEELRERGPRYVPGVIVTQVVPHYRSSATGVLRYREHLRKYYPEEQPSFLSLEGYIAGRILVEGLRMAGPNLTPETLVDGLEAIRDLDLAIGTKITFGPSDHQGSHKVWGTILDERGEYQNLDLD